MPRTYICNKSSLNLCLKSYCCARNAILNRQIGLFQPDSVSYRVASRLDTGRSGKEESMSFSEISLDSFILVCIVNIHTRRCILNKERGVLYERDREGDESFG